MDSDKKTTIAGGVSGGSLIVAGLAMIENEATRVAGIIVMIAGVALVGLGIWTNK